MCGASGTCTISRDSFDGVDCDQVIVSLSSMILFPDLVQVYQILMTTQTRPTNGHCLERRRHCRAVPRMGTSAGFRVDQSPLIVKQLSEAASAKQASKLYKLCDLFSTPPENANFGYIRARKTTIHGRNQVHHSQRSSGDPQNLGC